MAHLNHAHRFKSSISQPDKQIGIAIDLSSQNSPRQWPYLHHPARLSSGASFAQATQTKSIHDGWQIIRAKMETQQGVIVALQRPDGKSHPHQINPAATRLGVKSN